MNLQTLIDLQANRSLHYCTEFQGLHVCIENRRGSVREGKDDGGKAWQTVFKHPYGFFRGTKGVDGDGVDCFIGPDPKAKFAYVIHTRRPPEFTRYDEDKVMCGFKSASQAKQAYLDHYNNPKFFGGMTTIPMSKLKAKLAATKKNPQKLAAWGEPTAGNNANSHLDVIPTKHPPSLKNPTHIPPGGPHETDDRFLDVTRSKELDRDRLKRARDSNPSGSIAPPAITTLVQNHTG